MQRQGIYNLERSIPEIQQSKDQNAVHDIGDEITENDNVGDIPSSEKYLHYQVIVTATCFLLWVSNGMETSMRGTTFPDQRDRLRVTAESMGILYSTAALVALISCFLNGILIDLYHKKTFMIMAGFLCIAGVSLLTSKFLTDYGAYFFLFLVYRFCIQACDAIGNVQILRTWGSRATGPMYAIHLGFYVGGTIGPFLARPFLSPDEGVVNNCTSNATYSTDCPEVTTSSSLDSSSRYPEGSRIELAFLLPSIIMFVVSILFAVLYMKGPPKDFVFANVATDGEQSIKNIFNPKMCIGDTSSSSGLFLLFSFPFIFFIIVGYDVPIAGYLYTYATESDLGFTKQEAALIDGIYYFCGMMGRLSSMIIARWVIVEVIYNVDVVIITIVGSFFSIFGRTDRVAFAVCAWIGAFFNSPLWPGCIAWENKYVTVTASAFFLVKVGQQLGDIVFQPIYAGFFDEGKDAEDAMFGVMIFAILLFTLSFVRQIVGFYQGPRFQQDNHETFLDESSIEVTKCKSLE